MKKTPAEILEMLNTISQQMGIKLTITVDQIECMHSVLQDFGLLTKALFQSFISEFEKSIPTDIDEPRREKKPNEAEDAFATTMETFVRDNESFLFEDLPKLAALKNTDRNNYDQRMLAIHQIINDA